MTPAVPHPVDERAPARAGALIVRTMSPAPTGVDYFSNSILLVSNSPFALSLLK